MALASYAQATLGELKRYMNVAGTAKDALLEEALARAALHLEGSGMRGRRGVYRAPVESYTSIVNAQTIANGAVTVAGTPNSAGRTLVVRKTDADRSVTAGILTVTQAAPSLSETFDLATGDEIHGVKFFTAAVTASLASVAGAGAGDTIDVGDSVGYTELYSPNGHEIVPLEWPVQNVVAVHEDYDRLFPASALLVSGTGYEVRNAGSGLRTIARLDGAGVNASWACGRRVVRARMSAGWKGTAGVPQSVKAASLELAASWFQYAERHSFGLTAVTDATGTKSFSGPPILTLYAKELLRLERRVELVPTAERAWVDAA